MINKLFAKVDVDESGTIDIDELTDICEALGMGKNTDRDIVDIADDLFAKLDSDKNGSIDFNEFREWAAEQLLISLGKK